jgi:glycosyltransferase involved in cell wall biosynthesis
LTTPRLSILTPSYNYRRFLGDAVDSVRAQGIADVEHVIADGASTDGTPELLEQQDDVVWFSREDDGQSDALNRALALARGSIIGWLNADEFYLPDAFDHVLDAFGDPSVDVVYGDAAFVDEHGHLLRLLPQHRFSASVLRYYGCFIPSCAVFFRRSVLGDEPWDVGARTVMDWDLYLKMLARDARFSYVPQPLGAFRVHGAQVTATPLAAEAPEKVRIRTRHGISQGRIARHLLRPAGKGLHGALKLMDGSYRRQRQATQYEKRDMVWWKRAGESAAGALTNL